MKKETDNQLKIKEIPNQEEKAALAQIATEVVAEMPTPSAAQLFTEAIHLDDKETLVNMLKEEKVIIIDPELLAEEKKKLQARIAGLWKAELIKVAAERDVYGQFFFSLMDLVAKTPPLFDLVSRKLSHLTKVLNNASLRPEKKPSEKGILRSIFGGLTKLLLSSKNRNLMGVHLEKVEFKKPFFQMMETGNIPVELEALTPKVVALKAANTAYQDAKKALKERQQSKT